MSWTTPSARTTGELITSSIWNTDLKDDLILLKTSIDNNGHLNWIAQSKAVDYTLTTADDLVFFTVTHTATLPASPVAGKPYGIKAGTGVTVTVAGNGHNIDGAATFTLNPYDSAFFIYSGSEWSVF
jgi:hypothetical protein